MRKLDTSRDALVASGFVGVCALVAMKLGLNHQPQKMSDFVKMQAKDEILYVKKENIRWVSHNTNKKCFYVCTNNNGCFVSDKIHDKYKVCKNDLPLSYDSLKYMLNQEE